MGIPFFYSWIVRQYPDIHQSIKEYINFGFDCDNLYIDLNGIIHYCTHPIINLPKNQQEMFNRISRFLDYIISIIKPSNLIYIAIDGVPPRTKINSSRSRRFKSTLLNKKTWDSNMISPGTEFMLNLNKHLKYFICYTLLDKYNKIKILYSNSNTPGEGEHKIMNFIRFNNKSKNSNVIISSTHVQKKTIIYGLDSDLILLSLTIHSNNFLILRENVELIGKVNFEASLSPDYFEVISISCLRECLCNEFHVISNMDQCKWNLEKIIDDFVFICSLVGNDFLPPLPCVNIIEGSLSDLILIYKKTLPKINNYLINKGELNINNFTIFLMEIKDYEIKKLGSPDKVIAKRYNYINICNTNKFGIRKKGRLCRNDNENDYKKNYYRCKFGFEYAIDSCILEKIKLEYLKGLIWVLKYYYHGCPSWNWYYPYHYAPMASDLMELKNISQKENMNKFELGNPVCPLICLLSVLPRYSANLLPKCLKSIICSKKSSLYEFYPNKFEVDINGRLKKELGIALIPFINTDTLKKEYEKASESLKKHERLRNNTSQIEFYAPLSIIYNKDKLNVPGVIEPIKIIKSINKRVSSKKSVLIDKSNKLTILFANYKLIDNIKGCDSINDKIENLVESNKRIKLENEENIMNNENKYGTLMNN